MAPRTKILVVDNDLDTLSRIYLALVHRNYKVEASDSADEIAERIKRLKPSVLILGLEPYEFYKDKLKIPCIVLLEKDTAVTVSPTEDLFIMSKPVSLDALVKKIEELVY